MRKINLLSSAIYSVHNPFNFLLQKISSKSREWYKIPPCVKNPASTMTTVVSSYFIYASAYIPPNLLYFEANPYHISSSVNVLVCISER